MNLENIKRGYFFPVKRSIILSSTQGCTAKTTKNFVRKRFLSYQEHLILVVWNKVRVVSDLRLRHLPMRYDCVPFSSFVPLCFS